LKEEESVLRVRDLMARNIITIQAEDNIMKAASVMDENGVSSVVVKEGNEFSGMITERNIISRVVSKGLDPQKIKVSEVMSTPLITISPDATIEEAARKMRDNKIRRLLVEENHQKIGIIAESDIVRVDPELHFLIREKSKLEAQFPSPTEPQEVTFSGFCQDCGNYSDDLRNVNGRWLCGECRS
jgi:signal-transduction protein with cAMP-binding, CBS, and nucleotidyltransferase domain